MRTRGARPGRGDGGHADGLGAGGGRAAGERTDGARRDVQCRGDGRAGHRRSLGQAHARAAGVALSARAARGGGLRTTMLATRRSPARGALADAYAGITVDTDPATGALRVRDAQGSALATPGGTDRRAGRARRIQPGRRTGRAGAAAGRPGPAVRAAAGLGPRVAALPRPARAGRRGDAGGPGHGGCRSS